MAIPLPVDFLHEYGGAGLPLVLVGEILGGHRSWSRHAERLARGWRVMGVTPLITAHAAQGLPPPEGWGIPMEAQALAQTLDEANVPAAHLAGWSLGGSIALDFAMAHPEHVVTLTLVEPQARWVLRRLGRDPERERADTERFRIYDQADITEELLAAFLRMAGAVAPGEDPKESRAWPLAWTNRLALGGVWRVATHDDDPARLERLGMPVLLVRGSDSAPIDRAVVGALGEMIPRAALLELPGGHTSHITASERFLEAVERLLEGRR